MLSQPPLTTKVLRCTALVLLLLLLGFDNLRAWRVIGTENIITDLLFRPIQFVQNGWGMYGFDINNVHALQYRYTLTATSGGPSYDKQVPSSYGFTPSFYRTSLGNLDPAIWVDSSGTMARYVARFQCTHVTVDGLRPQAVAVEKVTMKAPKLASPSNQDGRVIETTQLATEQCF